MTNLQYILQKGIKLSEIYAGGNPASKKIYVTSKDECLDIVDGKFDFWEWLTEERKEREKVLTDEESKYLDTVIAPFRDQVYYIVKREVSALNKLERITIRLESGLFYFPVFKKDTIYQGMELERKYALEDLGL